MNNNFPQNGISQCALDAESEADLLEALHDEIAALNMEIDLLHGRRTQYIERRSQLVAQRGEMPERRVNSNKRIQENYGPTGPH